MTAKRDLKRRVRERQAKTGESYVTAHRNVTSAVSKSDAIPDRPSAIPFVEMVSVTEHGAKLGLKCRITMASTLTELVDPVAVLKQLRDTLLATADDPQLQLLRGVALRGEAPVIPKRSAARWFEETRRFVQRAMAGIGGVSETGNMLALHHDNVLVIAHLGFRPTSYPGFPRPETPRLVLNAIDGLTRGPDPLLLALLA